ncbi:MAG TPA: 2-dehydropantoate 2-reductase [Micropepsaceae bacterium]|nr:2-dehydropantoate 2-reductase [Micropepsaceae bacterium]
MRVIVVGAGGTGGYFGAKLAKSGADVTFLARGEHLRAIEDKGIRIRSAVEGEWSVKVRVVDSLAGHPPADLVLFCVKGFDTETVAESIRPIVAPSTGVLSIQNGVESEEKISAILGPGHAMGGVVYVFSNIESPGVIAHHQLGRIVFGEMNGGESPRAVAFARACKLAGIPCEVTGEIRKVLWEKYICITPIAGTTSLTRLPVKYIRELAETHELWRLQVEELLALAIAAGSGLDATMRERARAFLESLAPTNYSSLYQDLAAGKRLELETFHGHAVTLGKRYGIATPTLFAIYAALKPYALGKPR